jgi:hypothetical protein
MNLAYDLSKRGDMSRIFERGPKFQPRAPEWRGEESEERRADPPQAPARHGVGRWLAGLGTGLGALIILGALAKPGMLVRLLPRTAEVYAAIGVPVNLRGLAFEHVAARFEEAGKGRFLTVEGLLRNVARGNRDVPRLRLSLADAAGRSVYTWTASSGIKALPPGETAPFRARLAAPPTEAQAVTVDLVPE